MDKYFTINEHTEVLLYGAASIGYIALNICREFNIPVAGFIDKRWDEIGEVYGLPVYGLEDSRLLQFDPDTAVLIAVKNVFEHENIARMLIRKGFCNLLYRPYAVVQGGGTQEERLLNRVYDCFMNKNMEFVLSSAIPRTEALSGYRCRDASLVREDAEDRIVYVPTECVYTDDKKVPNRFNWMDLPVIALRPHVDFFRWLDGQAGYSYEYYMDYCTESVKHNGEFEITDRWKANVLKNRADVYNHMNQALERDTDFFLRQAPRAIWNSDGYFNLVSGKHRAAYLTAKGKQYIPLRISVRDYDSWINRPVLERVAKGFGNAQIYESAGPIEHPYFYDLPCDNRIFWHTFLVSFIQELAERQYVSCGRVELSAAGGVLLSVNDDGYLDRNLRRYGIYTEVYGESALAQMLRELMPCGDRVCRPIAYAVFDCSYGAEISLEDVLNRELEKLIIIVSQKEAEHLEQMMVENYMTVKTTSAYRDNEVVTILYLEKRR